MKFSHCLIASVLLVTGNAQAIITDAETSFTYGGIYKSLKTAQQTGFSQLSLNFFLKEIGTGAICPTSRVYLSDGENSYDLSVTDSGQLMLPLDKKLKQDHAAITLVTKDDAKCHLAMEIAVATFELENITASKVTSWTHQLDAIYAKLAGWPGKYFMPELVGLKFELAAPSAMPITFTDDVSNKELSGKGTTQWTLQLDKLSQLGSNGTFDFHSEVVKVTPVLEK